MAEWIWSCASGFIHLDSESSGTTTGAGTAKEAVHPSGFGKLVAFIEKTARKHGCGMAARVD